ncbi:hypothetical protein [uncultured Campylobacter sp.]|uniref:hypothetical protein n=1 Tax=uncultured Campylobacter sp. TaxID=218934 RepID=UPI0026220324|nr:hypothetical protein [uncultured Campylobacter sp.]
MKFKILEPNKPDDWSFNDDEELYKALGFDCWDDPFIRILAKIPGARKKDILDYFEYMIFGLCEWFELDGIILGDYMLAGEDKPEISAYPTYAGEYFGVMGQLFLGGMIDFGIEGENLRKKWADFDTNLSKIDLGMSLYEKWIYFRDNFFFGYKFLEEENITPKAEITWKNPDTWSRFSHWICMTNAGKEYRDKILKPRLYEKYKDVSIEV